MIQYQVAVEEEEVPLGQRQEIEDPRLRLLIEAATVVVARWEEE